tara:strand:- start:327 stop:485 length:159 start_codon:yes stop_codon:yes gene_type:complete
VSDKNEKRREAIASVARDLQKASGGRMTYDQARERVRKAKTRGEAIRNNNNR